MALLPVTEAQARLIGLAKPLPIETVSLLDARGRWLAEPIVARRTQPFATDGARGVIVRTTR